MNPKGAAWLALFVFAVVLDGSQALPSLSKATKTPNVRPDTSSRHAISQDHLKPTPNNSDKPVSVEAMLYPRRFNVQGLLRSVSLGSIALSFLKCVQTVGIPHVQAIWGLLHDYGTVMPKNYQPSNVDVRICQIIATATKELLPPLSLPSPGPLFALFASLIFYLTIVLLPRWFTTVRVGLEFRKAPPGYFPEGWKSEPCAVLAHSTSNDLSHGPGEASEGDTNPKTQRSQVCALHSLSASKQKRSRRTSTNTPDPFSHPFPRYFELNQCRYYLDEKTGTCENGGSVLQESLLVDLQRLVQNGLCKRQRKLAEERYKPYNRLQLTTPSLQEAFYTRISSPLVVVQIFGRLLAFFEEGAKSLRNVAFTVAQHFLNAREAISLSQQMAMDVQTNFHDSSSLKVLVLKTNRKGKRWVRKPADELVPGDIFVLSQQESIDDNVVPVDALVLSGQILTNEAVLTGESVPQSKTPFDFAEELIGGEERLDLHDHRGSILFAGTSMLHCGSDVVLPTVHGVNLPPHNQSGVICLSLRTGTYSSKGQLLRALRSYSHVGAIANAQSERDAVRLIASLSVFAAAACASLFLPHKNSKPVSMFRRIIQCTRIAIASIPSELPLALSAVARTCSKQLRRDADVICSEPGSLLTAAHIDTVVFDKTGTLTADTQSLSRLITATPQNMADIDTSFQRFILAGCHSLTYLKTPEAGSFVGDPLDLAALQYSGWKYNDTAGFFHREQSSESQADSRLWPIHSFPFDPRKRRSTSLVLSQSSDHSYSLWMLSKGSPETLSSSFSLGNNATFTEWYDDLVRELAALGHRTITLGARDISDSTLSRELFPAGLSGEAIEIERARAMGGSLHRSEVEDILLEFSGMASFDASVRSSSQLTIDELRRGGIRCMMLTGDGTDASLAVARSVGLVTERKVAVLEANVTGASDPALFWRVVDASPAKASRQGSGLRTMIPLTRSSLKKVLKWHKQGKCALAAGGRAVSVVLNNNQNRMYSQLADKLTHFTVIARATPEIKKSVIRSLRFRCGQKVMMCGDGVNDVAAMNSADVAVAMLNGYGHEVSSNSDEHAFEDERRRNRAKLKRLGRNRWKPKLLGSPQALEARNRMRAQIEEALREKRTTREAARKDSADAEPEVLSLTDMVAVTMKAIESERRRRRALERGGGEAARILAEDRRRETASEHDETSPATIKPGEASLVASFSCLHPSIDGVDAILRAGVATAACALATQEMIALHSLMSCFHLATLYRDGFRYGKNMWPVEIFLYILADNARFAASCTPRPRLPPSRALRLPESMFRTDALVATATQALVHLLSMSIGVNYGRQLEGASLPIVRKRPLLRLVPRAHPVRIGKLLSALANSSFSDGTDTRKFNDGDSSAFRPQPFQANYETNVVFIFSILQSAISCLVNHKGKPFGMSILESRQLCLAAVATVFLSVGCIVEIFPPLNFLLELRPLPSRRSMLVLLLLVSANALACAGTMVISEYFAANKSTETVTLADQHRAADLEEELLREEEALNLRLVLAALGILAYLSIEALARPLQDVS